MLNAYKSFKLDGDLPTAMGVLNSMPGQRILITELQALNLYGDMMKAYAEFRLHWDSIEEKKDKKVSPDMVKRVSHVRSEVKIFSDFMGSDAFKQKSQQLFHKRPASVDQMLKAASLGVEFDLSGVPQVFDHISAFIKTVVTGWVSDCNQLADLITKWSVTGWELKKDRILEPENKSLVERMLDNGDFGRCGKGVAML
eukprot:3531745-Pyramimonas_sp.AAC.1